MGVLSFIEVKLKNRTCIFDGLLIDARRATSTYQVTYRLTYEDVEDMLASGMDRTAEEWELGRLDEFAQLRYM